MIGSSYRLIRSTPAERDLREIRKYTVQQFGRQIAKAYGVLLRQALKDIRNDPFLPGSRDRPDLGEGARSYHISLSRARSKSGVKHPRHFVLYTITDAQEIVVVRVLHDSRDRSTYAGGFDQE